MRHHLITATAALGLLALAAPAATAAPSAAAPSAGSGATAPTCSGSEVTSRLRSGWALPDRARRTAEAIRTDTVGCRQDALVWRTTRDRTRLSFGITTPRQAWALPDDPEHRYGWTAVAMGTQWGTQKTAYATYRVWPRVATPYWADSDTAWQEVVDAGLLTPAQAEQMREAGTGYMGWRVGVSDGGKWVFDIAGD